MDQKAPMLLTGDFHTHTKLSHGKGTILDNVRAAYEQGLTEIAITDHGPGHIVCGLNKRDLKQLQWQVDKARSLFPGMNIYTGVEANIIGLDGTIDIKQEDLDFFDVLLMGFHECVIASDSKSAFELVACNLTDRTFHHFSQKRKQSNTQAFIRALERYPIDAVTHIGCKIQIDEMAVAKAAAQTETLLEINSKHPTPGVEVLSNTLQTGVEYLISSDAHNPRAVGCVLNALQLVKEASIPAERIVNLNRHYLPKKFQS